MRDPIMSLRVRAAVTRSAWAAAVIASTNCASSAATRGRTVPADATPPAPPTTVIPPEIVIVRGAEADRWRDELAKLYSPHRLVFAIPADLAGLDAAVADKESGAGTRAYVCRGSTCSPPVETLADLVRTAQARTG